jgi:hypothetical protein
MNAKSFGAFGYLVLFLDLFGFGSGLFEILWYGPFRSQPMKTWVAFLAVFIVGLGLIGLRKWAAIYFSAPLLVIGLWIFWTSVEAVPFPGNLVYMLYGVSLMLPAVVTVRLWPYLSWRGKWFF